MDLLEFKKISPQVVKSFPHKTNPNTTIERIDWINILKGKEFIATVLTYRNRGEVVKRQKRWRYNDRNLPRKKFLEQLKQVN